MGFIVCRCFAEAVLRNAPIHPFCEAVANGGQARPLNVGGPATPFVPQGVPPKISFRVFDPGGCNGRTDRRRLARGAAENFFRAASDRSATTSAAIRRGGADFSQAGFDFAKSAGI
jgi:hypothetical protein